VSGTTDTEGVAHGDVCGDPVHDAGWVQDEIHRWIFDNVKRKWQAIVRRPGEFFFCCFLPRGEGRVIISLFYCTKLIDLADRDTHRIIWTKMSGNVCF
jgi:hypothetical protein